MLHALLALLLTPPLLAPAAAAPAAVHPSAEEALRVSGDLPRSGALTLAELKALGAVQATVTIHGRSQRVTGVNLEAVLQRFGFTPGPMGKGVAPSDKRDGYRRVVVAQAPDGFQAVFSAAELCHDMGATQVLVAWDSDGQPLPKEQGPLRLVVVSDKEPSRSLHQLQRLVVVDLRKVVPPLTSPLPAAPQR